MKFCRISPIDAGLVYLTAPALLFFLTWFNPWVAAVASVALCYALLAVTKTGGAEGWPTLPVLVACAAFAIAMALTSATSPLVNGSSLLDLGKHRWITSDLVSQPWPVVLEIDSSQFFLRYGLGYYLVPAAAAKLLPVSVAGLTCAWLAFGLFLVFCSVASLVRGAIQQMIAVAIFAFFSGLDIVYFLFHNPGLALSPAAFLENWSYSTFGMLTGSNPFNLGWTPQHTIPAWVAALAIYARRNTDWLATNAGLLFVTTAIWSPLCAIAVMVFLAFTVASRFAAALNPQNAALAVAAVPILCVYFFAVPSPSGFSLRAVDAAFLAEYAWFVILEFGALALLLFLSGCRHWTILTAAALATALPFVCFGNGDLQMRASVVCVTILLLAATQHFQSDSRHWVRSALAIFAALGVWAGAHEHHRAALAPIVADWSQSITALPKQFHSQYLANYAGTQKWLLSHRGMTKQTRTAIGLAKVSH
jgi:hypothetical protein